MTTLTEDTLAHLGVLEDLTRKPRDLSELPPITDSHEPLEDQFFRVLAGIPHPRKPE